MEKAHDIFVPGRVCLFGEHSDWAGGYRRVNSSIRPGKVIISGTNQGAYARVKAHPDSLVIHSTLTDGSRPPSCNLPMDREALLTVAEEGGFYSYAAGVAYTMLTYYQIKGLEIDNYLTDLPVRKGLSSSACFCVLVARAFNRVYDLKLTPRAEMEAAYQGEILTPSRCGRMDQGCAFGQVPVEMTFDGDLLKTRQLGVKHPVHLLVGDLKGRKDTVRILGDLNRAYPFPNGELEAGVVTFLGSVNEDISSRAAAALAAGDAETLGNLMTEAQAGFDRYLRPACPMELAAPKLHAVLGDERVKTLTYGGKGVGSQGDGCVQFVAKDSAARKALSDYLAETYGMDCFDLDLIPPKKLRKAVIPAAGFGTRMFPASKAVKKEFFPVVTSDGIAKPVILAIVEEAFEAGIDDVAIIVKSGDEPVFDAFFREPLAPEHYNHLSDQHKRYCEKLRVMGEKITYIPQAEQAGFGHAVNCAADWVGDEPFLLMLGDHLYVSDTDTPCAKQLVDAYDAADGKLSVVGVYVEEGQNVCHYGTVAALPTESADLYQVSEFAEKPSLDYARQNLVTAGLAPDHFLCVYGQYVLNPSLFTYLQDQIACDYREGGEIQLTTALDTMRREEGVLACRVAGQHYDTGLPGPYVATLNAVHAKSGSH
ncbi:MAG: sugar phosphate nucleotidyltransferase [Lentisphaeria bacterium]|nr:sugar phosphate nucleotidyltransferase [Lentisphaeria bacterium]